MPESAAVYARISLDRDNEQLGVKRQQQDCLELAERLGWTVSAGNLRSKDGSQRYYQHLIDREYYPEVFNISNIGTRIDLNGQIDCYELYLELYPASIKKIAR